MPFVSPGIGGRDLLNAEQGMLPIDMVAERSGFLTSMFDV
jgi:hypothetical protein